MDARVQRMIDLWLWYCGEANLGYDQYNRWDFPEYGDTQYAGECDCSSLMYHCAVEAGFDLPTSGTRYTGTMERHFTAAGFRRVPMDSKLTPSQAGVPAGAILWKSSHTGGWSGRYICEAYGDENGGSHGGRAGDQGDETRISPERAGWECYYEWPEAQSAPVWPQEVEPIDMAQAIDYPIEEGSNNIAHENDQQAYMYRYTKWASGKMDVLISDYFNGGNGARYEGQYYIDKTLEFPEMDGGPAFVEPPIVTGVTVRAHSGWADVQLHDLYENKAVFWAFGTRRAIPRFSIDVKLEGSWK